jgi:hypothetical protein
VILFFLIDYYALASSLPLKLEMGRGLLAARATRNARRSCPTGSRGTSSRAALGSASPLAGVDDDGDRPDDVLEQFRLRGGRWLSARRRASGS